MCFDMIRVEFESIFEIGQIVYVRHKEEGVFQGKIDDIQYKVRDNIIIYQVRLYKSNDDVVFCICNEMKLTPEELF